MKKLLCILIGHQWNLHLLGKMIHEGLLKCKRCKKILMFEYNAKGNNIKFYK